jgi:Tfp pilus assembly protein PilO
MFGPRERLVGGIVVGILLVAVMWIALVSPERSKASNLQAQISTERTTLSSEQAELSAGEQARSRYPGEVHALAVLLHAVPTSDQEPQLIRLVNTLENDHVINWRTTSFGSASVGGFEALDVSFSFIASYVDLQKFISALDALTESDGQNLLTKGRLATVSSLSLAPLSGGKTTASVTMTVYMQPSGGATGVSGPVTTTAAGQ